MDDTLGAWASVLLSLRPEPRTLGMIQGRHLAWACRPHGVPALARSDLRAQGEREQREALEGGPSEGGLALALAG